MKTNKLLISLCLICSFAIYACDKEEVTPQVTPPDTEEDQDITPTDSVETVPVELSNEYEINGEIHTLNIVRHTIGTIKSTFELLSDSLNSEGMETSAISIQIQNELIGKDLDLSTVNIEQLKLSSKGQEIPTPSEGTLKISKDKFGQIYTFTGDAKWSGQHLRWQFKGRPKATYASSNTYVINDKKGELQTLFRFNSATGGTVNFAFGTVPASTPADLLKGEFCVWLSLSTLKLGKGKLDLSKATDSYSLKLINYATKEVLIADENISGSLITYPDTEEGGQKIFYQLMATLNNSINIQAEFYGEPTKAEDFEILIPDPNDGNSVVIKDANGMTNRYHNKVTSLQVKEDSRFYDFYFMTDINNDPTDIMTTPHVKILKRLFSKDKTIDIDLSTTKDNTWIVEFQGDFLFASKGSSSSGYRIGQNGKLKASIDKDQCEIYLELVNSYKNNEGKLTGSNETLYLYYKGGISPFTGN